MRQQLIWVKQSFILGRQDYQWQHEPCLYGWKPGAAHRWEGDRKQGTVLRFDRPVRSAEHPTMKPVKLFDYLIRNSSRPGDIVLDPFAGSGTTLAACEQSGRTAYVAELDPGYAAGIADRWRRLAGEEAAAA
ncbi:MAG: DNA-methyltransferase [Flavonifractor plautii]